MTLMHPLQLQQSQRSRKPRNQINQQVLSQPNNPNLPTLAQLPTLEGVYSSYLSVIMFRNFIPIPNLAAISFPIAVRDSWNKEKVLPQNRQRR